MPALETETSAPPVTVKLTLTPSEKKSPEQFEATLTPILEKLGLPEADSQSRPTIPNAGRDTVTDYTITIDKGGMLENMQTRAALTRELEQAGIINCLNDGPVLASKK